MLQWKACTCTWGLGLRLGHNTLTWDWELGLGNSFFVYFFSEFFSEGIVLKNFFSFKADYKMINPNFTYRGFCNSIEQKHVSWTINIKKTTLRNWIEQRYKPTRSLNQGPNLASFTSWSRTTSKILFQDGDPTWVYNVSCQLQLWLASYPVLCWLVVRDKAKQIPRIWSLQLFIQTRLKDHKLSFPSVCYIISLTLEEFSWSQNYSPMAGQTNIYCWIRWGTGTF